jgi:ribosomal protein S18 acetylase RimI-like enzyme
LPKLEVVRTYVEMRAAGSYAQPPAAPDGVRVRALARDDVAAYRRLYREVGRDYHWVDRLEWTDEQLRAHLARRDIEVFALEVDGREAGWYELAAHPDGSTEIVYFGIIPAFHRRGLGRYLLGEAVARSWAGNAERVWLHTCTLDDPAALPNYIARGFTPYRTERYEVITE